MCIRDRLFVVVSVLMAVSVIVLYFTTNEPKLAAAEKEYEACLLYTSGIRGTAQWSSEQGRDTSGPSS